MDAHTPDAGSVQPDFTFDLCLSGGGFRATLYHLGVVRLLFEAGLLGNVRHLISVSGGSILAAHLILNWKDYLASGEKFRDTAKNLVDIAGFDLRNRILRRVYKTPTTLLERYYERELYTGKQLQDLGGEGWPRLWLLTTNLTTGSPACFTRQGLHLDVSERAGDPIKCEDQPVALAVAASSAFPAFFPPMALTPERLRVSEQALHHSQILLTDGGVYDNLGVRALRAIRAGDTTTPAIISDASLGFDWTAAGKQVRFVRVLRTAWRSYDIASNRIYKLDRKAEGKQEVFLPIAHEVKAGTTLEPAVQRQIEFVRTDFDRFGSPEIVALVQHGYEVARDLLGSSAPFDRFVRKVQQGAPWHPFGSILRVPKLTGKLLYRSRSRRLPSLMLKMAVVAAVAAAAAFAAWRFWTRPILPASLTAHRDLVIASPTDTWLTERPWLGPHATQLSAEGRAERGSRTDLDYRVIRLESEPLPSPTIAMWLTIPYESGKLRPVGFVTRTQGGRTSFEPLMADGARVCVPPSNAGDVVTVLGLEVAPREVVDKPAAGQVQLQTQEGTCTSVTASSPR